MIENNLALREGERRITVDAEHFGIRFAVPMITIVVTLVWHFVGLYLFDRAQNTVNSQCIVLPLDVLVLFSVGFATERVLKRKLPSRRFATLSDEALTITDGRHEPPHVEQIVWDKTINVLAWRFEVRRRTRIPKGWYCMSLQLLQDEEQIILYTFMSPEEAEKSTGYHNSVCLRPRKETVSNTDLSQAAEQRRLLKLEDARWSDGAEIRSEDFHAILAIIERIVPGWQN